jgi:pyruvate dehydrogenase E2 component (dihydrolipoamide acetyltransferase)
MAVEIKMPQLSDTMDAGKILAWKKSEGDTVNRGDILAEVETDKANLEIEAFHAGTLLKVLVPVGTKAVVGEVIAVIGAAGESYTNGSSSQTAKVEKSAPTVETLESKPVEVKSSAVTTTHTSATHTSAMQSDSSRIKASPLAKKLADQNNINLSQLAGSGPNGRIVKKDIEQAKTSSTSLTQTSYSNTQNDAMTTKASQPSQTTSHSTSAVGSLTPLSKMRSAIGKRMQQAVLEAPHFYTTVSVDMTEANKLRAIFKTQNEYKDISINHLIIKAAAYALNKERGVNCSVKEEQLYNPADINIGIITAVEGGLLIPVIHNVDKLSLKDLAFESRAAIDRARAGRPSASDLSGGTFSISNMGMFDVENFTAIISPGQGAILAVGASLEQAIVKNGSIVIAPVMKVTLSVDHRIIDGTMAGNWLKHFKQGLEQPALLLM